MLRPRTITLLSALLTAACALEVGSPQGGTGVLVHTETERTEGEAAASPTLVTGTSALEERLLETGILEVGNPEAPLVLFAFTNHSCFYCGEFQREHFHRLLEDFIRPGKLRLQVLHLPLKKYPWSSLDATALICAAEQGQGLTMHERLFALRTHTKEVIQKEATHLKLDEKVFRSCLEDPGTELLLAQQRSLAESLSVTLVPTSFLNGEKFIGLPDYADLRGRIEAALQNVGLRTGSTDD